MCSTSLTQYVVSKIMRLFLTPFIEKIYNWLYFTKRFLMTYQTSDVVHCENKRQKRYLVFTKDTQYGAFVTVSVPLHPETLVSVAWFFEANYYSVDNATWFQPLLGDIDEISRSKEERSLRLSKEPITRKSLYILIEAMLESHSFPGRACLLRAICEHADSHFLHNGVLGDILYLILTPSASMSEDDLEDCYYEAEYLGLESDCDHYSYDCPQSPLEFISVNAHKFL